VALPVVAVGCVCWVCRGLKRGGTVVSYATTKMWEIMTSMELNERSVTHTQQVGTQCKACSIY
jgi:hypothetical protein